MYHPSMLLATFSSIHAALIAVIVVLLLLSAFFSASETALTSMNLIRIRGMAENKVKGARKALYISEHYDRCLTTILVGNNIVNILSTTLCAFLFSQFLSHNPALMNVLNTVVMTIVILITGEILPKALAKARPEKFAVKVAGPIYVLMKVLYPIVICFYGLQKLFTKKKDNSNNVTVDELESIIDTMEEDGMLDKDEADMLQGTFKIKEATAHDIMTHRVDVVFLNVDSTVEEIEKAFSEHQYSRIPVYKENTDNVVGLLNIKDFFNAKISGKNIVLSELMKKPLFTAENTNIDTLIKDMQKAKKHLAVVIDENGGVSGIVTMEDCIETIVGEIYDETDQDEKEPALEQVGDDEYSIDAEISVEELFDRLEIENVPENPYQTINSFLFDLSEEIPENKKVYEYFTIDELIDDEGNLTQNKINMIFTITKMEGHRIRKVNLKISYIKDEQEEK
ncbi:MAG: HlyC/CorC family transporter [Clostridia bacterium]|nr:HlyC/CorC family transporter [Clostridia bacterium]